MKIEHYEILKYFLTDEWQEIDSSKMSIVFMAKSEDDSSIVYNHIHKKLNIRRSILLTDKIHNVLYYEPFCKDSGSIRISVEDKTLYCQAHFDNTCEALYKEAFPEGWTYVYGKN